MPVTSDRERLVLWRPPFSVAETENPALAGFPEVKASPE